MLKIVFKDKFFYQLYFQTPGIAETELEADVRTALRKFYHMASGQMDIGLMIDKPQMQTCCLTSRIQNN